MSSKTDNFNINLILVISFVIHSRMKYARSKASFKMKLTTLSQHAGFSQEEIHYAFLYLLRQDIIFTEDDYLFVNLDLARGLFKKETRLARRSCLHVQPNFEIIASPDIPIQDLFSLVQLAQFKYRDVIYKFKITDSSLHQAFLLKWNPSRIKKFLSSLTDKPLPENIEFMIDEIYTRVGELKLGMAGAYLTGNKYVLQQVKQYEPVARCILKEISPTLLLLDPRISFHDLFYDLEKKGFFPKREEEAINFHDSRFLLSLSPEEMENFYASVLALKQIGLDHKLSINFHTLQNLLKKIEKTVERNFSVKSRATQKSIRYQQELKNTINRRVLKTIESDMDLPRKVTENKISSQYKGANPASQLKDMKKMIEYALKKKTLLVIKICNPSSSSQYSEYLVEPRFLYKSSFYAYINDLKEERKFDLKKTKFLILPGAY
ncbi:MAG: helicase-associated domain-containing protein [Spirochaetes bacterium]|nr:helicase-associated domain-containing protein [Spirochaetota bacterium]